MCIQKNLCNCLIFKILIEKLKSSSLTKNINSLITFMILKNSYQCLDVYGCVCKTHAQWGSVLSVLIIF